MRTFLLILGAVVCSGCASITTPRYAATIKDLDKPLIDIQRLIARTLPIGLNYASPNGREMHSKHFIMDKGVAKAVGEVADRYVATVTVLGDRRPYTLEIVVARENRKEGKYRIVGYDIGMARQLERRIQQELAKRREDLNVIDDFRVF